MRKPSELQSNIRKPSAEHAPPKLCGSHGSGIPDAPAFKIDLVPLPRIVKHRGELIRSDKLPKFTAPPPPKAPSEAEIRKVADEAVAAFMKRWMGSK